MPNYLSIYLSYLRLAKIVKSPFIMSSESNLQFAPTAFLSRWNNKLCAKLHNLADYSDRTINKAII